MASSNADKASSCLPRLRNAAPRFICSTGSVSPGYASAANKMSDAGECWQMDKLAENTIITNIIASESFCKSSGVEVFVRLVYHAGHIYRRHCPF